MNIRKIIGNIPILTKIRSYQRYIEYTKEKKDYDRDPIGRVKRLFREKIGYELNLEEPKTFNEKLQWLKFNWYNELATKCVDKYCVREYIRNCGLGFLLNDLIGVYDSTDDIDWDGLPKKFVLKANHASGMNLLCKDKQRISWRSERVRFNTFLKMDYSIYSGEWVYRDVKPKIIIEKYLEIGDNHELPDYKVMCFNGIAKCIFVCHGRNSNSGLKVDFYDKDWILLPFTRHYPNSGIFIPKPVSFDKMINYAEQLSKPFPFVRVDFYDVNGRLYFGELTFFPGGGLEEFNPEHYDTIIGNWLQLPIM